MDLRQLGMGAVVVCAVAIFVPKAFSERSPEPAVQTAQETRPPLRRSVLPGAGTPVERKGAVRIASSLDGHFVVNASIGPRDIPFMIDTGATLVALTWETGKSLDLVNDWDTMDVPLQTANGMIYGKSVTIRQIRINPIQVTDVRGVVMPPGALSTNLLGMAFLTRLKSYSIADGTMTMIR